MGSAIITLEIVADPINPLIPLYIILENITQNVRFARRKWCQASFIYCGYKEMPKRRPANAQFPSVKRMD